MMIRRNGSNQCPNICENATLTINIESRSNSSMSTGVSGNISRASSHMSNPTRMGSVPSPLSSVDARELESPNRMHAVEVEVYNKLEGGKSNLSKAGSANSSAAGNKAADRPQETRKRWQTALMVLLVLVCMCLLAAAVWLLLISKHGGTVPPPEIEASLGRADDVYSEIAPPI